jgi:hypothetical protein
MPIVVMVPSAVCKCHKYKRRLWELSTTHSTTNNLMLRGRFFVMRINIEYAGRNIFPAIRLR